MSEETKKYVVVAPNTRVDNKLVEVGTPLDLTPERASKMVNKVRPADEVSQSKAGRKAAFEKENEELKSRVEELEKQNKALHAENTQLKAAR